MFSARAVKSKSPNTVGRSDLRLTIRGARDIFQTILGAIAPRCRRGCCSGARDEIERTEPERFCQAYVTRDGKLILGDFQHLGECYIVADADSLVEVRA